MPDPVDEEEVRNRQQDELRTFSKPSAAGRKLTEVASTKAGRTADPGRRRETLAERMATCSHPASRLMKDLQVAADPLDVDVEREHRFEPRHQDEQRHERADRHRDDGGGGNGCRRPSR